MKFCEQSGTPGQKTDECRPGGFVNDDYSEYRSIWYYRSDCHAVNVSPKNWTGKEAGTRPPRTRVRTWIQY